MTRLDAGGRRVLVACEFSGIVREAFRRYGHDAVSCDLLPTEIPGPHYQGDVRDILNDGWDLMIAHPECRFLSYAGQRWFKVQPDRMDRAKEAFSFFMEMINAPIPMIAVENPRGFTWQWYRKPDQIIQPYEFGHDVTKATCLWLKDLPPLMATLINSNPFVNWTKKGKFGHSSKNRARSFTGIADAMAVQWGGTMTPATTTREDTYVSGGRNAADQRSGGANKDTRRYTADVGTNRAVEGVRKTFSPDGSHLLHDNPGRAGTQEEYQNGQTPENQGLSLLTKFTDGVILSTTNKGSAETLPNFLTGVMVP